MKDVLNPYLCTYNNGAMDSKLTLKLDKKIIERAKLYAESKQISLSKLIEMYLRSVTAEKDKKSEISTLVAGLSGVIKLPKNFKEKDAHTDHLMQKYK